MEVRFYIDPDAGRPHCERHGISTNEAEQALRRRAEDGPAGDGKRTCIGSTSAGRLLRIVYVVDPDDGSTFVITAYDLSGKALGAFRRRRRRRRP